MKKLLILAFFATFTLNNAQSITIPKRSLMNLAQNCIKQIVCADTTITDQNTIDQLYNISDYMKTYCSTAVGSNKDTLDLKTDLHIESSILTDILDINNRKIDITEIDKNELEEIFLVADYLLVDLTNFIFSNSTIINLNNSVDSWYKISPNRQYIITNNPDKSINIINPETGSKLKIKGTYYINNVSLGKKIIAAFNSNNSNLEIIDTQSGNIITSIPSNSILKRIEITPDNKYIIAINDKSNLKIINIKNGLVITINGKYESYSGYSNILISPNSKFIVASHYANNKINSMDKDLDIIGLKSGKIKKVKGIEPRISPDGQFVYFTTPDYRDSTVINFETGNKYNIKGTIATISPNSKFMITYDTNYDSDTYYDRSINIIETKNGSLLHKIDGIYTSTKISPDSKFIIALNEKTNNLDIIDSQKGIIKHKIKYKNINNIYRDFEISPDSKFIILSDFEPINKTIYYVIEINSGKIIYQITGFDKLKISANGEFFIALNNSSISFINSENGDIFYKIDIINNIPMNKSHQLDITPSNRYTILSSKNTTLSKVCSLYIIKNIFFFNNIKIMPNLYLYKAKEELDKSDTKGLKEIVQEIKSRNGIEPFKHFFKKNLKPSLISILNDSKISRYVEKKTNHPIQDN